MNRLESIKERHAGNAYSPYLAGVFGENRKTFSTHQDVAYLLQRLDRYESALIEFTDKHFTGGSKSNRDDYVALGVTTADIYKLKEALKDETHT